MGTGFQLTIPNADLVAHLSGISSGVLVGISLNNAGFPQLTIPNAGLSGHLAGIFAGYWQVFSSLFFFITLTPRVE